MRRTGSARRVFFGSTGAHRINGLSMCTPRAGNPPFPVPGGAAKYPIRELIAESPQAPANEAATQGARQCRQPPVFRKNRQSALIRHAHGRPCISRPIPEHAIHAVSRHTRGPGSTSRIPAVPRRAPKIPNMHMQDGIPCKRVSRSFGCLLTRFSRVRECRRRAGFTTPAFSRAMASRSPSICGTAARSPAHGRDRTPPPEAARVPHPGPAGPCRAAPS